MKLTKYSIPLALILSLQFGLTTAQAQDVANTPKGIQTIRVVQGQPIPPQEPLQVQGKSIIVVDKDGKKTEIPLEGNGSITITRSAQETNKDGKVERKVMGKAIIVGPDGIKQEIELDGGGGFGLQLGGEGGPDSLPGFMPATAQISKYFIGVHCEPVDDATREELRLAEKAGLQVLEVTPDSPAQKAGLQAGDILLYANDSELGSREQLIEAVQKAGEAKDELAFSIVRDGKEDKVVVRPGERPEMPAMPGMPMMPAMPGMPVMPAMPGLDLNIAVDGEGMAPDMEALKKQMEQLRVQILQNGPEGVVQGFAVPMPGIIRGLPEGFDPEQMEQLKAEMESARKQLEQAREEMEKAQTELREELQRTQREIREQMDEARKQLEKAIQELRKSKEGK
jgi:hypothetical protein